MKKILVTGIFNVLHPGHIRLLKFAKSLGDTLIVGIQSDRIATEGAHVKDTHRLEMVVNNISQYHQILLVLAIPPSLLPGPKVFFVIKFPVCESNKYKIPFDLSLTNNFILSEDNEIP